MEARLQSKKLKINHNNNRESSSTSPGKKNEQEKTKSEFEFCKVCRRNHDQGQRHKYFPSHTKSLTNFLSRFQSKINDIRFFLKNPSVLRSENSARNSFWCVFCDSDFDELGSSFACGNAINHLASEDHLKNLKQFLWKYGGGMDRVDAFRILEADVAKWEKRCKSLKREATSLGEGSQELQVGSSNDIHNDCDFENMKNFAKNSNHPFYSNISNGVVPLQYSTNEYQVSHSGIKQVTNFGSNPYSVSCLGPGGKCSHASNTDLRSSNNLTGMNHSGTIYHGEKGMYQVYQDEVVNRDISAPVLQNLMSVSSLPTQGGGNVHSGAPPPWFDSADGNPLKPFVNSNISASNRSGKSKLNPKRVGAAWAEKRKMEMEMEKRGEIAKSDYDPNWLPNFGRVWQSGTRKESRKEFKIEKPLQPNVPINSEMPTKIQPYVSKRMRKDASQDSGDPNGKR